MGILQTERHMSKALLILQCDKYTLSILTNIWWENYVKTRKYSEKIITIWMSPVTSVSDFNIFPWDADNKNLLASQILHQRNTVKDTIIPNVENKRLKMRCILSCCFYAVCLSHCKCEKKYCWNQTDSHFKLVRKEVIRLVTISLMVWLPFSHSFMYLKCAGPWSVCIHEEIQISCELCVQFTASNIIS